MLSVIDEVLFLSPLLNHGSEASEKFERILYRLLWEVEETPDFSILHQMVLDLTNAADQMEAFLQDNLDKIYEEFSKYRK